MIEAIVANITSSSKPPSGIEFQDMVSWGVEGLIKAHKNFDPTKGSQFKTYAFYRIRGEILDKIRSEWRYRNPNDYNEYRRNIQERVADYAEAILEDPDSKNESVEDYLTGLLNNSAMVCMLSLENIEVISDTEGTRDPELEFMSGQEDPVWEEVKKLKDDERRIIELFYVEGKKQKEIAEEMNYSRSTVCRMHTKILGKLRHRLSQRSKTED